MLSGSLIVTACRALSLMNWAVWNQSETRVSGLSAVANWWPCHPVSAAPTIKRMRGFLNSRTCLYLKDPLAAVSFGASFNTNVPIQAHVETREKGRGFA